MPRVLKIKKKKKKNMKKELAMINNDRVGYWVTELWII